MAKDQKEMSLNLEYLLDLISARELTFH